MVREICDGAVAGKKLVNIARELNEKGYETPARYFQRKNPDKRKYKNTSEKGCWNSYAVRRILRQEMYYGAVVQHKREGVGWNHSVAVPKEEQIIVEDRHLGIVTKEEFLEAQKVFHKRGATRRAVEKAYPLWRKVKCGTCGRVMPMKSGVVRGMDYRYFYCPHAMSQVGDEGCTKEFAREDEVKLSTNPNYSHGYETQIEEYGKAENTNKMIYVLIDMGNLGKVKTIENMYSEKLKSGEKSPEILIINAVAKKSASVS